MGLYDLPHTSDPTNLPTYPIPIIDVNQPQLQVTPSSEVVCQDESADILGPPSHYPMASHCGNDLEAFEPIPSVEGFFSYPAVTWLPGGESFPTTQRGPLYPSIDLGSAQQGNLNPSAGYAF